MVNLLVYFAVLAVSLQQGDAIRCYVCSSKGDPSCRDPFQKTSYDHKLMECTPDTMRNIVDNIIPGTFSTYRQHTTNYEDFQCVKAVTREHEREIVVRSCTVPRSDTFDVCSQLKSRDLAYCQTCSHDSCNGAGGLGPLSSVVLAGAALVAVLSSKY